MLIIIFSLLLVSPRILGCSKLQTRPLKLVIKIRDHIFYLFSPFSFSRWNWRLLLRKRLLPPGQEENLFHHKTECIDTWEKFRKIIYLSKIPWWIIYCRYEKVFDSKSLFRPSFIHPPQGLKSFYCWPKNNSWSFFPSLQRYSNWIIIVEIFS